MSLIFKISYGLYVLSASDAGCDNGCMINTFAQQTSSPERMSVTVNKQNLTHDMIANSGKCVVSILSTKASFDLIKNFGMQSGKVASKFSTIKYVRALNGVLTPTEGVIGYFELKVEDSIDIGTHTMFLLSATANNVLTDDEPLTYGYYQSNIKPKPITKVENGKEKWICKVCGYIHEGPLSADFICPLCDYPASDFERIPVAKTDDSKEKWICKVCGYIHEGPLSADFICPICKHPASDFERMTNG